jgi:lipoprotein-releasing system permease protein
VNFPFYIARRYLFSKKSHNIINIISGISLTVVAVVTMAMIIVLSAFNGIESLVGSLYAKFEPDIIITPAKGKTFLQKDLPLDTLRTWQGIEHVVAVIEENVMIDFGEKQRIARMKGVDEHFVQMTRLDSVVVDGEYLLKDEEYRYAVVGYGIKYELGINIYQNSMRPLKVFAPIRGKKISRNQEKAFNRRDLMVAGIFSINPDFDSKYFLTDIDFASELLGYENERTAIEIGLVKGVNPDKIQEQLMALLGDNFVIKTSRQKNELIFKTSQSEKWITFFILTFILLIASFNIIASLTMLIIDKKKDIFILNSLGASRLDIRKIFFSEGMLINAIGAITGLALGYLFCIAQLQFGLIPLEGGIVEYYPIEMRIEDFFAVFGIVLATGLISSIVPVRYFTRK